MILYHFTRPDYVDSIKQNGLIRGDVPTSPAGGFNAPWLTDDPTASMQDWIVGTDKNKVRFTISIKQDKNLRKWSDYATSIGMDSAWYKILDKTGGGGSEHWYIFLGRIPASWITDIEYL